MDNACEACPLGHTCDGAKATACAATNYVDSNECKSCPSGFTCDGATATACDKTKYVLNNECTDCPDGHTCDGAEATKSEKDGKSNKTNQGSTPLIVGLCVGAAVLVLVLAVVVRKLRGRAAEETSMPEGTEVQPEA